MIPYSRLFIAGIFGIMLIAAGFSLLFKKNYYLKLYKLIAYSLVVYGLDILFLGDIFDGYGLDNINLSRLYFIIFWVVAYFILRWTGKGENIRTILTNKTSMTYWGIAALIVILPDFVYFVLIIDYY